MDWVFTQKQTGKVASYYTNSAVYWPISLYMKVSSGLAKRCRFLRQGPDSATHFCSSFKTTNKHDIISGACPTCASWLRCTGLVGCHGYPPQTFWWAPWVRCDGREGGRLSPRPLHRTDWRQIESRSQRAPTQNLRVDERRQRPGQCAWPQYIPRLSCSFNDTHSGSIVCPCPSWTSPLPAVSQTPYEDCVPMRGHTEASFPFLCSLLAVSHSSPYRYHHIHRGRWDMYHNGIQCAYRPGIQFLANISPHTSVRITTLQMQTVF